MADTDHRDFWSADRRRVVADAAKVYCDSIGIDKSELVNRLMGRPSTFYSMPIDKRGARQVVDGGKRQDWETYSGTHDALCNVVDQHLTDAPDGATEFEALLELRHDLRDFLNRRERTPAVPDDRAMDSFVELLSKFVEIDQSKFVRAWETFFSDEDLVKPTKDDVPRKRYALYRYFSEEAKIAKSFVVLRVLRFNVGQVCTFTNYFPVTDSRGFIVRRNDDSRVTRGIVIPTDRVVYFIGGIDKGMGLKIMALNKTRLAPIYTGLLTSFEPDGAAIAARFVMKESDCDNHTDANLRIRPETEFVDELGDDLEKLRHPIRTKAALPMWKAGE